MAGLKSLDTGILSLVKLKDRFKGSSMALRTIQKQSIDIRCHKLEQGLQNVQGKTSQIARKETKRLKSILQAEKSKEGFKRLKQIFNPQQGGALSKVHVPVYDSAGVATSWKTEFESDALDTALLEHCQRQYRKASSAQFGHRPMRDLLGFNGITEAADQILEGKLFQNLDDACSPEVIQLTAAMVVPDELTRTTANEHGNH